MEIRQLEYFRAVTGLGSVTKAAAALHVAQPSVTVAIKKLEAELGVTLFDRAQRKMALTAEGRVFRRRAEEILRLTADALAEMQDYNTLVKGEIKVGVSPMIGAFLFPHIFAGFRKVYPNFQLTVTEAGALSIRRQLERRELDLGITIISDPPQRLETSRITSGEVLVCMSREGRFSGQARIPFGLLRDQPFILFREDAYSRQLVMNECRRHRFTPRVVFSSSQVQTILGLVEEGVGITFLLDAIVKKHPAIAAYPLADPLFLQVGLVWSREGYMSKAVKTFVEYVRGSVKAAGGNTPAP